MDFISLTFSESKDICFVFGGDGEDNSEKMSEIKFSCNDVEVVEERFVDKEQYNAICEEFAICWIDLFRDKKTKVLWKWAKVKFDKKRVQKHPFFIVKENHAIVAWFSRG